MCGNGDTAQPVLNLRNMKRMFSFTLRPIYPPGKETQVSNGQETGWTPHPARILTGVENSPCRESNHGHQPRSLDTTLTPRDQFAAALSGVT